MAAIEYVGLMGVNNNILGKFADVSVHELYENGKWTFDEFKKLLQLCATDETVHPLSYYEERLLVICSILANGSNLVVYDETMDKYSFGMLDPKAMTAIEYAKSLVDESLAIPEYDNYGYFKNEQRTAFTITETWCLGGDIDGMDMICYPFGPDAEYGKDFGAFRSVYNRYVFTPITTDTSEIGRFVDLWFEEIEGMPKSMRVENFKNNNFFNDESYNMWMTLAENASYDYSFELNDIYSLYWDNLRNVVFGNRALSTFVDAHEERFTYYIDENLNN